ncbi:MAG: type II toxin-antitoxin system RelE/ParE family toxin [Polaribacter sp.]|nr:type II toxin-antitoxin system RelE/ParE family toxin [Polaribacter sp.]
MANYKLTRLATADLVIIYKFGVENFGLKSSQNYILSIETFLIELSNKKEIARDASILVENLKFYNYKGHVIFYEFLSDNSIRVIRVLGKRMNFKEHL